MKIGCDFLSNDFDVSRYRLLWGLQRYNLN